MALYTTALLEPELIWTLSADYCNLGWPYFQTPKLGPLGVPCVCVCAHVCAYACAHVCAYTRAHVCTYARTIGIFIRMGENYFSVKHTYRAHVSTLWTPWTLHFCCLDNDSNWLTHIQINQCWIQTRDALYIIILGYVIMSGTELDKCLCKRWKQV